MTIRLSSWNVNGIRAIIKKGEFHKYLEEYKPDILCLQETKAHPEQVELELPGYQQYWNAAEKKGYSGTAIFTKFEPVNCFYDIGMDEHDQEGRVITLEYSSFFLVTVYTPNSGDRLKRLEYRSGSWDIEFFNYLKKLEEKKPIVFCGDLNVAHKEIDLANPKTNTKNAGFTPEERAGFDRYVEHGFIDTFRHFVKDKDHYTWWSYRTRARERNIGWRIDYFCVSNMLKDQMETAHIHAHVLGSDHCPVALELKGNCI